MTKSARIMATYDDLFNIPEHMIGEIIEGELIVSPRPSIEHIHAGAILGNELGYLYHFGRGGPGGWIIYPEPEIKLEEDTFVPDLAGWKGELFLKPKGHNWISVAPDWVCEILSPRSIRHDRITKMGTYARHRIGYFWLVDPINKTLEVLRLESGRWIISGTYAEDNKVRGPSRFKRLKSTWPTFGWKDKR